MLSMITMIDSILDHICATLDKIVSFKIEEKLVSLLKLRPLSNKVIWIVILN